MVRLEVLDRAGQPLDRRFLAASPASRGLMPAARSLSVGDPAAAQAFSEMKLDGANVPRLVPDAFGCAGIPAVWIDASVIADPALTDAFWRRVLLGGTVVLGLPENIQALTTRLGPSPRVLLGAIVACSSDQDLHEGGALVRPNDLANLGLLNQPSWMLAHAPGLQRELVDFSRAYLGIFLLLQVVLLAVAFGRVRGARRVWLWLAIPLFALVYTVLGILCSRLAVADRAEVRVEQIEQQREGWPEALLLSDLWNLDMASAPASFRLPADSRQYEPASYPYFSPHSISYLSRQDADGFQLVADPSAGWHSLAFVRSWIPARPPCVLASNGQLTPQRDFSQAWLLDDGTWRNLGPLRAGQPVTPAAFSPEPPGIGTDHDLFPPSLRPLLQPSFTDALQSAGDGVFFGIESDVDATVDHASDYRVQARRVVAYQFHLAQATP